MRSLSVRINELVKKELERERKRIKVLSLRSQKIRMEIIDQLKNEVAELKVENEKLKVQLDLFEVRVTKKDTK